MSSFDRICIVFILVVDAAILYLNRVYQGGALNTYGLDAGYFITPVLKASAGYCYQRRNQEDVDGFLKLGDIKDQLQTTDLRSENRFVIERFATGTAVESFAPLAGMNSIR
jgi:hypothetical protein